MMKKRKRIIDIEESPLGVLLNTHMQLHERIFSSTSLLLIVTSIFSSLIIGFFFDKFLTLTILMKIGVIILIFSSLSSLIICLLILRPELKHRAAETEFYYMDIFSKYNKEQYKKRMYQILKSDKTTIKFITEELYALGNVVLAPNFKKIKLATEILITGVILSTLFFILSFIFPAI